MPRIAIVVSSEGDWLARASDAVRRQTASGIELVVAPAGGVDEARAVCEQRVRGFEHFAWLADGVVPHPEWVEALLSVEADAVTCDTVLVSASCADLGAPPLVEAHTALYARTAQLGAEPAHVERRLLLRRFSEPERKGLLSRWR